MITTPPRTQFERFREEALANPEIRAAYEDAQTRIRLVDALVRMRRRLSLTQTQVAKRMGVKQPSISGFETEGSDPRLSTLLRYARAVEATVVCAVRPKLNVIRPDVYLEREVDVQLGVSHVEPSARALTWDPEPAYKPIRAVS